MSLQPALNLLVPLAGVSLAGAIILSRCFRADTSWGLRATQNLATILAFAAAFHGLLYLAEALLVVLYGSSYQMAAYGSAWIGRYGWTLWLILVAEVLLPQLLWFSWLRRRRWLAASVGLFTLAPKAADFLL